MESTIENRNVKIPKFLQDFCMVSFQNQGWSHIHTIEDVCDNSKYIISFEREKHTVVNNPINKCSVM